MLEQTLSALIERIDNGFATRMQTMSEAISKQALEASRVLDQSARQINSVLDPAAIEATISSKIRDLNVTLAERSREVLENLREGVGHRRLARRRCGQRSRRRQGRRIARASVRSEPRPRRAVERERARAARGDGSVDDRSRDFDEAFGSGATLADRSRAIVEAMETQTAALHAAVDPQRLEGALADRVAQLNSAVAQRNTELLSTLIEGARAVESALNAEALEQIFATRIHQVLKR